MLLVGIPGVAFAQAQEPEKASAPSAGMPDDDPTTGEEEPWTEGISPDDRRAAERLYAEANGLLEQGLFAEALTRYREALSHWEKHPRIHYKIVAVLQLLGRFESDPVMAHEHARRALRYGGEGLDAELADKARRFARELRSRLVELEVSCDQHGVEVEVDGVWLMTGPGTAARLVVPGDHQITASKPGYLTVNESVSLPAGTDSELDLRLFSLGDSNVTTRRWPRWQPWAAVGVGAGMILGGGILHWRAEVNKDRFDRRLMRQCQRGCVGPHARSPSLSEGQETAARVAYGVGVVTLTVGLFLAYSNRSRSYHIDRRKESLRLSVTPAVSPNTAGVQASLRF